MGTLTVHHFFQGFGLALLTIIAHAEFLAKFPIYQLPLVYMLSAGALIVVGRIYAFLEHRVRLAPLFTGVGVAVMLISFFCWAGMSLVEGSWIFIILMVAYRINYLLVNLEFWGLSAVIFDVRQSKRLFSLISSGDMPAKLFGYLSVSVLAPYIGIQNLLLIGSISFGISLVIMTRVLSRSGLKADHGGDHGHEEHHHQAKESNIFKRLFGSEFTIVLALLSAIAIMSLTVIDYSFLSGVKKKFYSDVELAKFLGYFLAAGQGATIFLKLFLSGRIIDRLGVKRALLILPILLLVVGLTLVSDHFLGFAGSGVFILFGILMMVSEVFNYSFHGPVLLALFQPLDRHRRLQGHTVVKGLSDAISLGLAGALLYLLTRPKGPAEEKLVIVTLVLLGLLFLWIFMVFFVNRKYLEVLKSAVKNRFLEGSQIQITDEESLNILKSKLESPYPEEVIYTLELLRNSGLEEFHKILPDFLNHTSDEVVHRTLQLVEAEELRPALPQILELIHSNRSPELRRQAIISFCRLAEDEADPAFEFLNAEDLMLRSAAIAGLMQTGGIEEIVMAGDSLLRLLDSEIIEEQREAIRIIGNLRIRKFYKPLLKFLKEENLPIQRTAIEAAAKLGNARLLPELFDLLDRPALAAHVIQALPSFGESAVDYGSKWLDSHPEISFMMRMDLIRFLSKIPGSPTLEFLEKQADSHYSSIREVALQALGRLNFKPAEKDKWLKAAGTELHLAYNSLAALKVLDQEKYPQVSGALQMEVNANLERAFLLLEFIFSRDSLEKAHDGLRSQDREKRANALEILDHLMPNRISDKLIPLLEGASEKLDSAIAKYSRIKFNNAREVFEETLRGGHRYFNRWTLATVLFATREKPLEAASSYHNSPFLILKQTAGLSGEPNTTPMSHSSEIQLLEIEKVIILKSSPLFSETPEEILVEVARILKSRKYEAGKPIFDKNDMGDVMYIIYDGKVRIHDGDLTFGVLGKRDFFGELALLDPAPRSAAATAEEDCLLLELAAGPFYELVEERSEVSRGILKTLARRIRRDNEKISELKSGQ